MDKKAHKFLLVILTLALAVAPLRGAWAMPDIPASDNESHCAQMQHTGEAGNSVSMVPSQQSAAGSAHDCKQGCDGNCCDSDCSTCVPGSSAVSATLAALLDVSRSRHNTVLPVTFSGRTVIPPLRPPLSP